MHYINLRFTYLLTMAAMMSFQAEECCQLVSEYELSAACLCSSVRQFLIYSTFVLVLHFY